MSTSWRSQVETRMDPLWFSIVTEPLGSNGTVLLTSLESAARIVEVRMNASAAVRMGSSLLVQYGVYGQKVQRRIKNFRGGLLDAPAVASGCLTVLGIAPRNHIVGFCGYQPCGAGMLRVAPRW